jgi:hypothetical protein
VVQIALVVKPYTFTVGATIVASEHNSNFDTIYNDYNGNVTNANLSASFSLTDDKIGQISTYGKVDGSAITNIDNLNSAAGYIPVANLNAIPNSALATVGTGANYLVALDASAKLPAVDGSQLTGVMKSSMVYDSGWIAIALDTTYTLTHSLGTTKCLISVFQAQNSDGSGWCINSHADNYTGFNHGFGVVTLSTTQVQLRGGAAGNWLATFRNAAGSTIQSNSHYGRIIMLALE